MKREDKVFSAIYALMGAGAAFAVHCVLLGGWRWLFLGKHKSFFAGPGGMAICVIAGAVLGVMLYREQEAGVTATGLGGNQGESLLIVKRIMVIGMALIGLYFLWDLARGI